MGMIGSDPSPHQRRITNNSFGYIFQNKGERWAEKAQFG
jgi:hypothetical protein